MTLTGWFGLRQQVLFALSTVNADRDEDGNYLIFWRADRRWPRS
jgi:hypothetical protein